jgi:sugar lactone lactonase YvrE
MNNRRSIRRKRVSASIALVMLATLFTSNSQLSAAVAAAPATATSSVLAAGDSYTFGQTGITVTGDFWTAWQGGRSFADSLYINGLPITAERNEISLTDGKTYMTQWFERARFEYHPEYAAPNNILLGLLGTSAAQSDQNRAPFQTVSNPGGSVAWFSQTGHTLGDSSPGGQAIAAAWNRMGGLRQFGYPLSQPFMEVSKDDGKSYLVQYFERQRFEYHPENQGTQYEVLLGRLGAEQAKNLAPPKIGLQTLASGFGSPDDLTVTPSGDIIFGDFGNNAINILTPGGTPRVLATGFNEPEGIVVAKDGALIVAEQGTNRILEVDPQTGAKKVLRQLVNNTGQDGVDGIGLDPATGDILIPDSPYGRLLRMNRDGSSLQTIASGFVRPTGAAVEPDGTIIVAEEFGNVVDKVNKDGSHTRLATIFQPDDVVVGSDGSIYANSLGGEIARIDPTSGKLTSLTSGLNLPHGLGILGNELYIAEAGRNRILELSLGQ